MIGDRGICRTCPSDGKQTALAFLTGNREHVIENRSESNFLSSIEEMIIEGFGYRSDRVYREPPGGSPLSTGSPSQMPRSQ
jgi:hypothetical protein